MLVLGASCSCASAASAAARPASYRLDYYYHTFVKSGDFYKISTHRTLYHRKVRKILYRIRSFGRLA